MTQSRRPRRTEGFNFKTLLGLPRLLRARSRLKGYPLEIQSCREGCGDACAAMLLEAAGMGYSEQDLPRGLKSMGDIWDALEAQGLECGLYRCPADALGNLVKTPAVVRFDGCHFAVLWEVLKAGDGAWFLLSDPAEGRLLMTRKEFKSRFHEPQGPEPASAEGEGYALWVGVQVHGSAKSRSHKGLPRPTGLIWDLFKGPPTPPTRRAWAALGAAGILLLALQWCYPMASRALMDLRLSAKGAQEGARTAILVLLAQGALMAGRHAFNALKDLASKVIEEAKRSAMDLMVARKVAQGLPKWVPPWRFSHGDLMQLMEDSSRMGRIVGKSLPSGLLGALGFTGILGAVWILWPQSAIAFTIGSGAMAFWNWLMRGLTGAWDRRAQDALARYREQASEAALSIWDARHPRIGRAILSRWTMSDREALSWSIKRHAAWTLMRLGSSVIREGQYLLASYITAAAAASGDMSIGRLMAVQFAAGQLSGPLEAALGSLIEAAEARHGATRLRKIAETPEEEGEEEEPRGLAPHPTRGPMVFQDVRFRYLRREVIKGLSLRVEEGERLLVVGPSGSGKSTLLKLASGLLTPTGGRILLGDRELAGRTLRDFRRRVGWVLQESRPLWGPLGWNVSLEEDPSEETEERALWALGVAGLSRLPSSLPGGLKTLIGPKGVTLSRGESQRLMIARCVYGLPDVIILDEATASLDDRTEEAVLSNLMKLPNNPTIIMSSHKTSLRRLFHRTIRMEEGATVLHVASLKNLNERDGLPHVKI
ncbi:MAG: ATP-binding cassette domain-containing protein [Thermanaerothrix sp.]|nr:ATP-binding cassette domain-containing protein [Thermanaerothrix sp.]